MKNIFRLFILTAGLFTISCTDEIENREAITQNAAPVLRTPSNGNTFVLNKDNANDLATTFVWEYAAYNGTATVVNYSIEFAAAGTNNYVVVATSTTKFKEFKVGELNTAALDAGFAPFVASNVDVRIKSSVGTTGTGVVQYSNKFTITLTPYPSWPNWGIIGSAISGTGWNSDVNLDYSLSTRIYSITMPLIAGEIKFRLDDSWGTNVGDNGNNLSFDANGANIPVPVAGNYTIKCNFDSVPRGGLPGNSYTITLN
jgi:hypothetical protein